MSRCKICSLDEEQQNVLDQMIFNGSTYEEVAKYSTECGYPLSRSSAFRHYTNHAKLKETSITIVDERIDVPEDYSMVTPMLKEAHLCAAAICLKKLRDYVNNKTTIYPRNAIEGLAMVHNLVEGND